MERAMLFFIQLCARNPLVAFYTTGDEAILTSYYLSINHVYCVRSYYKI